MKSLLIILISAILCSGCSKKENDAQNPNSVTFKPISSLKTYSYLALGDSYTIGEAVLQYGSFPYQLVQVLKTDSNAFEEPKIIAKTGWTTDDLILAIKSSELKDKYDFVTLLIGVNNQYRGYDIEKYKLEFKQLLQTAITKAGGNAQKVFVLSIPDYGVTPFAKNNDREKIGKEIDQYNQIAYDISKNLNANYLDITPISRLAKTDNSLIANDGLHPSAKMYQLWVANLSKQVITNLK